jgi:TonB-linked SusC/RagA family outer membrane protein
MRISIGVTSCRALLLALLVPLSAQAQGSGQIRGAVTIGTGQPLAGVTVTIQGTNLRAISAANGLYSLVNVPAGEHVITAASLGYGSQEQRVTVTQGATQVVNFRLQVEALALKEVVVVGYGTQRRETVTGSVETVTADEFVKGPARDAASLVAGKIAGLAVVQPSGSPTSGAQIQLRGRTTINGPTAPLVLIDGIPGGLQTIPAEDIESISVLKDGSAAAIYGTRGSNGVILITTKKHMGGAPTLRYDGYIGQSTLYKQPEFLSASDYRRINAEAQAAGKTTLPFEDLGFDTDWQSNVIRQPLSYRHNLSLSGGALNTNYTASLNVENEEGIFNRSDNNELTARANIRHQMFNGKLEAEATVVSRAQKNFTGPDFNYAWRQTLIRNPTDRVRDETGVWQERTGYFYVNPVVLIEEENGEAENRLTRLHGTLSLRPIQQLRFSLLAGTSRSNSLSGSATTFDHSSNTQGNSGGTARRDTGSDVDRIAEFTGTFSDQLGSHNVTLLGGYAYQDFVEEGFNARNTRFPTDLFDWNQLQRGQGLIAGEPGTGIESSKESSKLIGFFSRLNYDWKNKYLFTASVRYEGNSVFGADHKWGTFPSISAGWRLSEEPFMDGLGFIDDLRLRIGYGITGIAPNDPYGSLTSYSYGGRILYNGQWVQGLSPSRNPNPDLRWEEKDELNFGVNFAVLDSRLTGSLDVYRRDTKDMLYNYSVPVPPYLNGSIQANVGTMRNNGIEAELSYEVIRNGRFNWTTSANWSTNTNKLVTLSNETFQPQSDCRFDGGTGEPIQQSTHRNCVGQPIGNFYGYKSIDIDENGIWIVEDSSGNPISIKNATARDRHILGNGIPKQYFAWNNFAQLGGFDLSLNMRGAAKFQILNFMRMYYENPKITQYNMLKSAFEKAYGKAVVNHDLSYVSYYVEDGDYIKLDNATIGYTFNASSLGRLGNVLAGARVYVSGRNLLTITGYKGLDPEVSITGLAPGNDSRDTYPTVRRFTFGTTFNF